MLQKVRYIVQTQGVWAWLIGASKKKKKCVCLSARSASVDPRLNLSVTRRIPIVMTRRGDGMVPETWMIPMTPRGPA